MQSILHLYLKINIKTYKYEDEDDYNKKWSKVNH